MKHNGISAVIFYEVAETSVWFVHAVVPQRVLVPHFNEWNLQGAQPGRPSVKQQVLNQALNVLFRGERHFDIDLYK